MCHKSIVLLLSSLFVLGFSSLVPACAADSLSQRELSDKDAAKNANITTAEKLNGTGKAKPQEATQTSKQEEKNKQKAKELAGVVNSVPGVKVQPKDLEPPATPPIKGFHPIKRLLRPVENLEGMSIKLEQQIMKLEGPIAGLQPPMIRLHQKMTRVDSQIEEMQSQLNSVQSQVAGVRSDLADMRNQIAELKEPIRSLQKPLSGVAKPLEAVQTQLNLVLLSILIAAIAIAVGTPIAAILVFRHRRKLFPDLKDHELTGVASSRAPASAGSSRMS